MQDILQLPAQERDRVLDYLHRNGLRSERFKLFYVASPKAACTSIKWWFADLEGCADAVRACTDGDETDPDLMIHDTLHRVAPRVAGYAPEALAEVLASGDYFRFSAVRNPYKRLFSAWQSKLLLREPMQIGAYLGCDFLHRPIRGPEDVAAAFEGFLEHLAAREAPHFWDIHWMPQVAVLRPDLIDYAMLAPIENVGPLRQALAQRLGGKHPDPFSGRRTNESLIPYLPEFVSDRSAELIRSLYAEDFEAFQYDRQPPKAKETFSAEQFALAVKAVSLIQGRHQRLGERNALVRDLKNRLAAQERVLLRQQAELDQTRAMLAEKTGELNRIFASKSWRAMKPLRFASRQLLRLFHAAHGSPPTDARRPTGADIPSNAGRDRPA